MGYLIRDSEGREIARPNDGDIVQRSSNGQILTVSFLTITSPQGDYEVDFLPGIVDLFAGEYDPQNYATNVEALPVRKDEPLKLIGTIRELNAVTISFSGEKYRVSREHFNEMQPDQLAVFDDGFIRWARNVTEGQYLLSPLNDTLQP